MDLTVKSTDHTEAATHAAEFDVAVRKAAKAYGFVEPPPGDSIKPMVCIKCWSLVTVSHAELHRLACGPVKN